MKIEAINLAIAEAHHFIRAAEAAKKRMEADSFAHISGSMETAACRRASMDLSRALSQLRRNSGSIYMNGNLASHLRSITK